MINLTSSTQTKRITASLSALAVFAVSPQLVMQRKALPPKSPVSAARPNDVVRLPSIGSISGTVSWKVGQVTIPTPATDGSIQQVLQLRAVVSDNTPAAAAQAAPFKAQRYLPNLPKYGMLTTNGNVVSVSYTISRLPQGTAIQVSAAPSVTFQNNIPIPVKCSMSTGLDVKNYNFKFTVMMLNDLAVGSPANASDTRQKMAGHNAALDRRVLPSIGTISGTVSWKVGEILAPQMVVKGSDSTQSMLGLAAWIKVSQGTGTPAEPSLYGDKKVGTAPQYGQVTTAGGVVSVPYTIRGLPQGVSIWVQSEIPAKSFEGSIPGGVKCTLSSGLDVKNYNLVFKRTLVN
jgi:hypothetical protein